MKIAAIQLTSVLDYKLNIEKIDTFIKQAKKENEVKIFFLPEVFYSMSDGDETTQFLVKKNNEHFFNIRQLAVENEVFILGGTAATLDNGKIYNRMYNFDPDGKELESYDKIHLFKLDNLKNDLDEAKIYTPGDKVKTLEFMGWKLGLSICFDLRFSELYRNFFKKKAELITVSSAFTVPTGRAHWEVLLRARAIECQSYVVAANQVGIHNDKIRTYGHSMIINPWGEVLACAQDKEGYIFAEISKKEILKARSRINMQAQSFT